MRTSIRVKYVLAFLLVSVVPIVILQVYNQVETKKSLVKYSNQSLVNVTNRVYDNLNAFMSDNLDVVRVEALLPEFKQYLTNPKDASHRKMVRDTLIALSRQDHVNILSYALLDMSGIILVDSYRPNVGKSEASSECVQELLKTNFPSLSGITFSRNFPGVSTIDFCAMVRFRGKKVGIIRLRYNAAAVINSISSKASVNKTPYFMLIDENNLRIAHSALPELVFKPLAKLEPSLLGKLFQENRIDSTLDVRPNVELSTFKNQLANAKNDAIFATQLTSLHDIHKTSDNYVVVKKLKYQPWTLVGAQPQDIFDEPIMEQQNKALWLATAIVGIVVVFSLLLTQIITGKLKKLTKAVLKYKAGETFEKLEIKSNDEIEMLAQSFNRMAERTRDTMRELEESVTKVESAEKEVRLLNTDLEKRVAERTDELNQSIIELKQAQEQLITQEKMASLGRLVAGVAHEINTPIGISVTASSFLSGESKEVILDLENETLSEQDLMTFLKQTQESGEILQINLKRASEIVTSFKQLAVSQSTEQIQTFDLYSHLELTVLTLKPTLIEKDMSIEYECPKPLLVTCDPNNLSRVIDNLLSNAIEHGYKDIKGGVIKLEVAELGEHIQITVKDNGQGISSENLTHIFEPFFTTARNAGGTGLGMHLVYNIVHLNLKGNISCESEPGKGTEFVITMPVNCMS
ncbi:ATP-binding protein [Vibrio sp. S4M6]|uniref:sensor histidine kinase n=1 Tax=Vibrio sinus TaxID=2946865 RepID=UPI00202A9FE1|nr:ATP-binding protein [Vibrio sinus]MCL9780002.1 ATP-binding protein [Vibrio sinus]